MNFINTLFFILLCAIVSAQLDGNKSPDYETMVSMYKKLAADHNEISLFNMGNADCGKPIYLCIIGKETDSIKAFESARNSTTLLINNAIHPGEPDGVNACLIWINEWIAAGKPKNLPTIAIIPAYNIGGMLNRSTSSRANQNGPEEYGFRGNAQNLDLNRDFIKMDSKNMFVFAKIFHGLEPDVFVDTHVSNGADYQYTMTYIASVRERMAPPIATLMHDELIPQLRESFEKRNSPLIPYVDMKGETPIEGIQVFNDLPRYAMGYASLFNAISFTTETHMLKPFPDRVKNTKWFIEDLIKWMVKNREEIEEARSEAKNWELQMDSFYYNYKVTDQFDSILFHGFEAEFPISEVTGLEQLRYNRDKPYSKNIPYYNVFEAQSKVKIPNYIVLGSQCQNIIDRLKSNGVKFDEKFESKDPVILQARIESFSSPKTPYEGHYLHNEIETDWNVIAYKFDDNDVVVPMNQDNIRFILSVLNPDSPDSYFAWNFLDSYVQQKEYFSAYVFESHAKEMLDANETLRLEFEQLKTNDEMFRKSEWAQLYFLYKRSEFYEPSHNYLPIWFVYDN